MICHHVFFPFWKREWYRFKTFPGHSDPLKQSGWYIITIWEIPRLWQHCFPNNPLPEWLRNEQYVKSMAFKCKFACGLLCLAKISTKQHPKGDKKMPVGKKLNSPHFPTFLCVFFNCWLLNNVIIELCTEWLWSLCRISAVYFYHLRFGQGKQKFLYIFNIAYM